MAPRVSSGPPRAGPPAHANRTAFVHNRNSKKTRRILAAPISGLCPPCRTVLEWRKRYRKYKPLSVAKKCVRCFLPAIKEAYHIVCNACAFSAGHICCKCLLPPAQWRAAADGAVDTVNHGPQNEELGDHGGDGCAGEDCDSELSDRRGSSDCDAQGGLVKAGSLGCDGYDNLLELAESGSCDSDVIADFEERVTFFGAGSHGQSDTCSDLDGLSDGCSDDSSCSEASIEERIIELKI